MTLGIAVVTRERAIVASDRKISGHPAFATEESNKLVEVRCDDARAVVAYCGLARSQGHRMSRWLPQALCDSAGPDFTIRGLVDRFAARASDYFRGFDCLTPEARRATFLVAAFRRATSGSERYCATISNFESCAEGVVLRAAQARSEFRIETIPDASDVFVRAIGNTGAIGPADLDSAKCLAESGRTIEAVAGKCVSTIRTASTRSSGSGTIGKQCGVVCIHADPVAQTWAKYYSYNPVDTVYRHAQVRAMTQGMRCAVADCFERFDRPGGVPVRFGGRREGRNKRCGCGSKLRYRECCGRYDRPYSGESVTSGTGLRASFPWMQPAPEDYPSVD
jgi:hypothetical protein